MSVSLGDRQIMALQGMAKAFAGSRISLSEIVRVAIDDLHGKLDEMNDNKAAIAYVLSRGREDRIFMQPSAPETGD
jgi:hypothetical protein